ncbi:MAG TPA: pirin family protein [Anaerolineae bacterium]|nr:pirin family protein [Anaerolineae bacterium]
MINKVSLENLYKADHGWRDYRLHFSYAEYSNPSRENFGVLNALNDETLQPSMGFDDHPHHEMEIIAYCVHGELSHRDSLGNQQTIRRGDVQYMCAGSGIIHAEMNASTDESTRFINIWIQPSEKGLTPTYGSKSFAEDDRHNRLLQIVSGKEGNGALHINQDANIYVSEVDKGKQLMVALQDKRQAYLLCVEGSLNINGIELKTSEAIEMAGETLLTLDTLEDSHLLMVEMVENRL